LDCCEKHGDSFVGVAASHKFGLVSSSQQISRHFAPQLVLEKHAFSGGNTQRAGAAFPAFLSQVSDLNTCCGGTRHGSIQRVEQFESGLDLRALA
jgi:hypothetical protein